MEEFKKKGIKALDLSGEKEEEIMIRCYRTVEYLNDMAGDILTDFLHNTTCPISRQVLKNSPETLVIRSYEKAINILAHEIRRNDLKL
ncbi:MAG: hypothetical protein GX654_15250 [Desulfatiglans sp.]|jgi:hypothetical protein|nr:hypothetical protein [Desulfatiglans sp.]